jgi:hypothetical protein
LDDGTISAAINGMIQPMINDAIGFPSEPRDSVFALLEIGQPVNGVYREGLDRQHAAARGATVGYVQGERE